MEILFCLSLPQHFFKCFPIVIPFIFLPLFTGKCYLSYVKIIPQCHWSYKKWILIFLQVIHDLSCVLNFHSTSQIAFMYMCYFSCLSPALSAENASTLHECISHLVHRQNVFLLRIQQLEHHLCGAHTHCHQVSPLKHWAFTVKKGKECVLRGMKRLFMYSTKFVVASMADQPTVSVLCVKYNTLS